MGYSYFRQDMDAHGLTYENFSPPSPSTFGDNALCSRGPNGIPLRLGSAAEFLLTPRLKLSADAAYLPYAVRFEGTDVHLARDDVPSIYSPAMGKRQGVQLEGQCWPTTSRTGSALAWAAAIGPCGLQTARSTISPRAI